VAGTGLETFQATILVKENDIIGWWQASALDNCLRRDFAFGTAMNTFPVTPPDPTAGDTVSIGPGSGNFDLNLSANMVPGASRDQCRNGGWHKFQNGFKNQGECVSSFGL
jgi:hypothetical protein